MNEILDEIGRVSEAEMEAVLTAVRQRYNELFPSQELELLVVDKDRSKNAQIDSVIMLLQKISSTIDRIPAKADMGSRRTRFPISVFSLGRRL